MAYELCTFSGTPFGWRVQLAALIKGIDLDFHWLPFPELKEEAYLALNPRGKVPTLRDGDFVLYESAAILSYLDAKHPEPPLFGSAPQEEHRIRQAISEIDCYLAASIPQFAAPIFTGRAKEEWESVAAAAEVATGQWEHWEMRLKTQSYVASNKRSAADLALYPVVAVFLRAAAKEDAAPLDLPARFETQFPQLRRWMSRIEAIPRFEQTIPPAWD